MKETNRSMRSTAACRAYVGEATPAAAEYHYNDFDWEELKQEAEEMLAKRRAQLQVTYCNAFCLIADRLLQPMPTVWLLCLCVCAEGVDNATKIAYCGWSGCRL